MSQLQLPLMSEIEMQSQQTAAVFDDIHAMRRAAPALFATTAHPRMSHRYSFTNTYDILLHMHNKGFRVSSVQGGAKPFDKVLVRLRPKDYEKSTYAPELVVLDSHDGSSRIHMYLGFIEFLCMNGCIAGDLLYAKSYMHLAPDLMHQIMLELEDIHMHVDKLHTRVRAMKQYETTIGERIALADEAVRVRFGKDTPASSFVELREKLLHVRRADNDNNTMYNIMNVIQENSLRGGLPYQSGNRIVRMRGITNVSRTLNINQALWQRAEELMQRRAARNLVM